ncbi:FAD-dependent oxidoreductase [Acetobacterium sp.]|uniref:FAD-dependent oxidoreductase n=1 Tax=Acetobacterium sp. TaxID=1872094 RepID=UPI000CA7A337|nr:FAD-dependent oxidoreductase [Acetobacterium sp.]MDO9491718.1 FAD-dependent oxidoreductase [Acetobacterium sp.]PKM70991.1 MAG: dehydrogenase [Firmicutes bacterium HGW-Firmicutes-17]
MKIIVIGAVAGGTSAAAKARRNDDSAEIIIYEKDQDISYSGCGLPYFIGGKVASILELTPRTPEFFKAKYNIDIHIRHEVLKINIPQKTVVVKNLQSGAVFEDPYDKLIISTGAQAFVPPIKGIELGNVFFLRNVQNALKIKTFMNSHHPKTAVVVGTGFIGFEVMENLIECGIKVTLVERAGKLTPNLDEDMSLYLEKLLNKKEIPILKNANVVEATSQGVILENGTLIPGEMIIVATGVKPNVTLAREAGLLLGVTGAIRVDERMMTIDTDIYACGDCIETWSTVTKKPHYRPLGSTANKTGRICGDNITGGDVIYPGNLSTGIFKIFDISIGSTGLSESEARSQGYDIEIVHNIKPNQPGYYGGREMLIKAIADRVTQKLLGVQIIGYEGVDKRLDIFVTLITYGATVAEFFNLDLAYAPPFSTTKDPVHYTGMILDNALNRGRKLITAEDLKKKLNNGETYQIIDTRITEQFAAGHLPEAQNIPHQDLRSKLALLDQTRPVITYCNKGVTGNATQNILLNHDFKNVFNLSGGFQFFDATKED